MLTNADRRGLSFLARGRPNPREESFLARGRPNPREESFLARGRPNPRVALLGAWAALSFTATASAQEAASGSSGPSKQACAEAYESAQENRASGHLQETRERLALCAHEQCPSFVQKDCARWLTEVEKELPSVILSAVGIDPDAAAELDVKIDGKLVSGALRGSPMSLDPGRHELSVERPGEEPLVRTILAQQGVQNRNVLLHLGAETPMTTAAESAPGALASLEPYAYAAWGLGAVGFGVFAIVGTLGRQDEDGLIRDCPQQAKTPGEVDLAAGICPPSLIEERRSDYKTEFIVADVGLVTGLVGAAAGTVLFVLSMTDSKPESSDPGALTESGLRFDVTPTTGGAWGSLQGRF